jgi:hypothetical protein
VKKVFVHTLPNYEVVQIRFAKVPGVLERKEEW